MNEDHKHYSHLQNEDAQHPTESPHFESRKTDRKTEPNAGHPPEHPAVNPKRTSHDAHSSKKDHDTAVPDKEDHKGHGDPPSGTGGGHDHHTHMLDDYRQRLIVSLVITLPILLLSPMIQQWAGFQIEFAGRPYILFGLSAFVYLYGGRPFLMGMADEIKKRNPGMMTLIAMAISVAFFYSTATVFGLEGEDFFWELATLIDIMLLGHWIEMKSVLRASSALDKLADLMPDKAHRIVDGRTEDVDVAHLQLGDRILIKPGEKIPADGTIVKGDSAVDESLLTGESLPVNKTVGQSLIGGAVNGEGSLEMEVKDLGDDSYLSKVIRLVREAQKSKSRTQHLADRAAFWLTITALSVGLATLLVWLYLGSSFTFAIARMATVMVITCPHALGLAIPLVVAVSTGMAASKGLLIRNRTAFENARNIDTFVFDKTGTLTHGKFGISSVQVLQEGFDEKQVIRLAASLEQHSEHPLATGILRKAEELELDLLPVDHFQALKGQGVQGRVQDQDVQVVSPGYLQDQAIAVPESPEDESVSTRVFVLVDGRLIGSLSLSDRIREESFDAIRALQKMGIRVWMLTGDNEKTAAYVSEKLGLDGYFAEVLPDEKQEKIRELQQEGAFVAMTGDGVNDAPALAQADVGIAIGSGTDVAAETADIILVNSNPGDLVYLLRFGRATYRKMIQNLIWATGYNVVAIPLAAGVLISYGIVISPAVGAVLMSLSTVIVAINAQLLRSA